MSQSELPRYAVGIDIETTSLDPAHGDIIEVAAIRYDLTTNKEIERFSSLTKPRAAISSEIESLTGISNKDVADAQPFSELRQQLQQFVGDDIIFAHNATFDLGFLRYHGCAFTNHVWDTFPLASIAWPEAPSYNLGTLSGDHNIAVDDEHRAAADVALTWELLKVLRRDLVVSPPTHQLLTDLLSTPELEHYLPLFTSKQPTTATTSEHPTSNGPLEQLDDLEHTFSDGGPLAQNLPAFQARPEQLQMAQATAQAITDQTTLLVEAGTGTGKTYAYLVPLLQAAQRDRKAIISTHTRHLQDQLVEKDLPNLLAALNLSRRVTTLKGRRNYLCHQRLQYVLTQSHSVANTMLLAKILVWLDHGSTGELERLNTSHQGTALLRRLHADHPSCRKGCSIQTNCFYAHARQRAVDADCVVINHALLGRLSFGSEASLPAHAIVVDEAHHLARAIRDATALDLTIDRFNEIIDGMQQQLSKAAADKHLQQECTELRTQCASFHAILGSTAQRINRYGTVRLTPSIRRGSEWQKAAKQGDVLLTRIKFARGLLEAKRDSSKKKKQETINELLKELQQYTIELENFLKGNTERIQWIETWQHPKTGERHTRLYDVALSLEAVTSSLLDGTKGVIITSATIATNQNFSFIKKELGIQTATELILPSSFNYRDNMLIYLVDDAPLPSDPANEKYIADQIIAISQQTSGRLLGLFTSLESVKKVYKRANSSLYKEQIKLYAQNITGGRTNILKRFKDSATSVLLGTDSFWEGVDIPGENLSVVVIPKLPFQPPNDPVTEALAEAHNSGNTFVDRQLPQMIIKLRQGIGRLLRHHNDRGVVILLDSRLHQQRYGTDVIKSLPPATVRIGSTSDLIPAVADWLAEEITTWNATGKPTS